MQKDALLQQRANELEIANKNLVFNITELNSHKKMISDFYSSETFRYIVSPIWVAMDFFKKISFFYLDHYKLPKDGIDRVLFIKPQQVSVQATEKAIEVYKAEHKKARIYLLANLLNEDYKRLLRIENIDEKLFFCPDFKRFTMLGQLRIILKLRKENCDKAIILTGRSAYPGYRRARIFAFLSGAKIIKEKYIDNEKEDIEKEEVIKKKAINMDILKQLIFFPLNILFLIVVVAAFLIFIVAKIKIRKFFYRFSK